MRHVAPVAVALLVGCNAILGIHERDYDPGASNDAGSAGETPSTSGGTGVGHDAGAAGAATTQGGERASGGAGGAFTLGGAVSQAGTAPQPQGGRPTGGGGSSSTSSGGKNAAGGAAPSGGRAAGGSASGGSQTGGAALGGALSSGGSSGGSGGAACNNLPSNLAGKTAVSTLPAGWEAGAETYQHFDASGTWAPTQVFDAAHNCLCTWGELQDGDYAGIKYTIPAGSVRFKRITITTLGASAELGVYVWHEPTQADPERRKYSAHLPIQTTTAAGLQISTLAAQDFRFGDFGEDGDPLGANGEIIGSVQFQYSYSSTLTDFGLCVLGVEIE